MIFPKKMPVNRIQELSNKGTDFSGLIVLKFGDCSLREKPLLYALYCLW